MIKHHFELEVRRLKRFIESGGFHPTRVFLVGLLILVSGLIYIRFLAEDVLTIFFMFSLGFILWLAHLKARNKFFSQIYLPKDLALIRLIENLLITSPITLISLLSLEWQTPLVIMLLCGLVYLFSRYKPFKRFQINWPFLPTPFKNRPYEFVAGFRRVFMVYPVCFFVLYKAWQVSNFPLGLVSLTLALIIQSGFYSQPEPIYFITIHTRNAKEFINFKLKEAFLNNLIIGVPWLLFLFIWEPSLWWATLLVFFSATLYLLTAVVSKYAHYSSEVNLSQTILLVICLLFPPLMLVVFPWQYQKASHQLTSLLK